MRIFISGGAASGKSAVAEEMARRLAGDNKTCIYLATMQHGSKENEERIAAHRRRRRDGGFVTVECPAQIAKGFALQSTEDDRKVLLLESASNLLANEMFEANHPAPVASIMRDIMTLYAREDITDLVVVSDEIFADGVCYDRGTSDYITALGELHQRLAKQADEVIRVIAGIPVKIKARGVAC